jgi:plasmid stabilization system protein ParE
MASLLFHRLAAEEYRQTLRWHVRRSPKAAQRFRVAVDRALQRIANGPLQGSIFQGRFRWVRTGRFPYLIYYEIVDPTQVRVLAVAHGRRRLGYWLRRSQP